MADYPALDDARAGWRYQPPPGCLAGKVILVTGAGDGIGRAAAKTFALHGASVVLLGRTREKLEAVSDWIGAETDTESVIVPCDLAALADENAAALAQAIDGTFGRLDGLLHNASLLGPKVPIAHYPTRDWQTVFQVNVHAAFLLTRALLPLLDASGNASVVFTSSSVGRKGRAYWGAYAASKFAIEGLAQILADEHEHAGRIRFNSLNPGGTRTTMRREAYPAEPPDAVPPPEAHMDLYLYLFSDASARLSGRQLDARDWAGPG
ncbi:MAG: YciK family oxidoreductase [Pseudomonadales bacterium]|jgi:NAD(P)-dependent dehydrogenase (short-subunit alcohol dehydrogenase family)